MLFATRQKLEQRGKFLKKLWCCVLGVLQDNFDFIKKVEQFVQAIDYNSGKKIERIWSFCYLGITLDENLLWNEHAELICNKVSEGLGLLSRIQPFLTLKAAKCVYNS